MPFEKSGWVKARKEHVCLYCKKPIYVGECYFVEKWLDEYECCWITRRLHAECQDLFYNTLTTLDEHYDHWENWYNEIFV